MAVPRTYLASVVVLRKRKLGESDLILSMLAGDGSLIEAVAKGARKPTSSFATRLDLFCESEVMLARGRNLDIASEARLLDPHDGIRKNVAATYAASPILDCLAHVALPNLPVEHLFPMTTSALSHLDGASEEFLPSITAAFLVKLFALLGVRPVLDRCISCGAPFEDGATTRRSEGADESPDPRLAPAPSPNGALNETVAFSFADGGYICANCESGFDRVQLEAETLRWAQALLGSTFDDVVETKVPVDASFAVLHFAHRWLRETQNINSRALNELFACGLFS